jgi:hypothetical protein
LSPEALALTG